jgi:hypothetical protein
MGARKPEMKERILMNRVVVYSILNEEIKDDECGWS